MIGARDMAFPRLNAMSYWLFPFGGLLLHFSVLTGGAPAGGMVQLRAAHRDAVLVDAGHGLLGPRAAGPRHRLGRDAINIIVTILTLRAPGMTMGRVPLFVWMTFVTSFLIILALPVLNAALVMLFVDRQLDAHVFLASGGGSALLWQHFFWTFGHPEVYILALPAFGMISEIIPVFSRKPIFGYEFVAASTVAIAVLSFGVWAHHMFAVGPRATADLFFAAGEHAHRRADGREDLQLDRDDVGRLDPLHDGDALRRSAFLVEFVIGGLSGVTFAAAPDRLADDRHVLRRRAFPLRHLRRHRVRDPGRRLLLVSEDERAACCPRRSASGTSG